MKFQERIENFEDKYFDWLTKGKSDLEKRILLGFKKHYRTFKNKIFKPFTLGIATYSVFRWYWRTYGTDRVVFVMAVFALFLLRSIDKKLDKVIID